MNDQVSAAAPLMLLNYILQTKDKDLIVENGLTEDFFPNCRKEFNFIKEHIDNYGVVPDKTSFSVAFPDFVLYNTDESKQYLLDAAANYAEFASYSYWTKGISKASQTGNITDIREAADKRPERFDVHKIKPVSAFKDKSRFDSYVQRKEHPAQFTVDTGFKELNDLIGGWDRKDELAVIVARTNVGKTWVLLKTAVAACKCGLKVGLYSGEMSVEKVEIRLDTLAANISNISILRGNADVSNDYKRYIDSMDTMFPGEIVIITPEILGRAPTVSDFATFVQKEKLDMLCIDQLSLVEDQRHAKVDHEQAANVSRDLKNLQVLARIPIISVSQQNRTKSEDGPGSEQVARSDRIGQDATTILSIERGKEDRNEFIFTLVKSRDSANKGTLHYHADIDKGIFRFVPQDDDAFGGTHSADDGVDFDDFTLESDVF